MISDCQKKLVKFSQKFVNNKNYFLSDISYFATYEDSLGIQYLKSKLKMRYTIDFLKRYFKQFVGIANSQLDCKFNFKKKISTTEIIVSWAFKNNFDNKGNYYDKYLNIRSSKYKRKIWILIYMDEVLPPKIKDNIFLVLRKKKLFKYSLFFFLFYLIKNFKNFFFKRGFFLNLNNSSAFSQELIKILKEKIDIKNLRKVFLVYEGQLFQRELVKFLKQSNNKIKITGYDQSAPPALPLNLIYDNYSPDTLLTTGTSQKSFYNKHLNWPKSKLKVINSMRFKNDKKNFYSEKIFIPFELGNTNVYLNSFKNLIKNESVNFGKLEIKDHPRNLNNSQNTSFVEQIQKLLKKNYSSKKKKISISVFFGQTTAMINALELGVVCYHICSDPVIDSYSSKLWKNIKVTKIENFLFKYEIKKKKTFLNKGNKYYL